MTPGTIFIDTWGWVALGHRRDSRHADVSRFYAESRRRGAVFHTSDYVLDEVATLLFRREPFASAVRFIDGIIAAASRGSLQLEAVTPERFGAAWQMRRQFQDKPAISFTDLTSMVVMRECGISAVLTDDGHFLQVGMGFTLVP